LWDFWVVHELLDVDGARPPGLDRLQLEVRDGDLVSAVELVAVRDLVVVNLDALLGAPALHLDGRAVLAVDLAEMQIAVADRGLQAGRAR